MRFVEKIETRRLSERELQVLAGISEGKTNAEIGADLYLSMDTIKGHARRLYFKLGAKDRASAVHLAWQLGLLGQRVSS